VCNNHNREFFLQSGNQLLNPKKYVRNAGLVALGVVFLPAAAAAMPWSEMYSADQGAGTTVAANSNCLTLVN